MKYGLKETTIEQISKVFANYPGINEVILYGSRAKGNFQTGSDIDLTLKGGLLTHSDLNKISLKLDELFLPYTIDLSIYEQIDNADLIDHIKRIGVLFYFKGQNIMSPSAWVL